MTTSTTPEKHLLSTFLLPRSPLSTFLSLSQFSDLFPRSYREPNLHPGIEILYHELQHHRALVLDQVRRNIDDECLRSEKLLRELNLRRHLNSSRSAGGIGGDMDVGLFGSTSPFADTSTHTLPTILQEMEHACVDLESEVARLDEQMENVLQDLRSSVNDLNQLNVGRERDAHEETKELVQGALRDLGKVEKICS